MKARTSNSFACFIQPCEASQADNMSTAFPHAKEHFKDSFTNKELLEVKCYGRDCESLCDCHSEARQGA